jgi:large subunit ribosomal protein L17
MVTQLYREERIRTTKSKALEVRRRAEKLITRAKEDTVHNRRIVSKLIQDKAILAKLFTEIAPAFAERPGGYTRILKLGYRKGDAAEMVLLELVGREEEIAPRRSRSKAEIEEETAEVAAEDSVEATDEADEDIEDETNTAEVEEEAADTAAEDDVEDETEEVAEAVAEEVEEAVTEETKSQESEESEGEEEVENE